MYSNEYFLKYQTNPRVPLPPFTISSFRRRTGSIPQAVFHYPPTQPRFHCWHPKPYGIYDGEAFQVLYATPSDSANHARGTAGTFTFISSFLSRHGPLKSANSSEVERLFPIQQAVSSSLTWRSGLCTQFLHNSINFSGWVA